MRDAIAALNARAQNYPPACLIREPITNTPVAGGRVLLIDVPLAGTGAAPSRTTPCSACATRSCPPRWAKWEASDTPSPANTTVNYDDTAALIDASAPVVFAFVAVLAFLLLMAAFRSVTIPLISIMLNLLSVGAGYGLITLIFQDGRLQGLLGYTSFGGMILVDTAVHVRAPVRAEHGLPRVHPVPDPGTAHAGGPALKTRSPAASPAAPGW